MPTKKDILDLHFMDARYKLIDIAAFLDRIERHEGETDFRFDGLKKAIPILLSNEPNRAKAVLEALSDHSTEPAERATMQGAFGAPQIA
jgi:Mg/Co/Ni transporter MgtE